jgi:AcrR family transcriptional regulator
MRGMARSTQHLSHQPLLRSHILDAARSIVVRQGFDALSMRKIAEVVGYSPASLYLHFSGRDAIAHALCIEGYAQLLASLHTHDSVLDPGERVKAMAHAYVAFGRANPEVYRLIFMQNPAYTDAAFSDPEAAGETALLLFMQALASSDNPPAAAEIVWTALHGIVSLSLTAAKYLPTPVDVLIDTMLGLCLPGLYVGVKKKSARRRPSARTA